MAYSSRRTKQTDIRTTSAYLFAGRVGGICTWISRDHSAVNSAENSFLVEPLGLVAKSADRRIERYCTEAYRRPVNRSAQKNLTESAWQDASHRRPIAPGKVGVLCPPGTPWAFRELFLRAADLRPIFDGWPNPLTIVPVNTIPATVLGLIQRRICTADDRLDVIVDHELSHPRTASNSYFVSINDHG